jgi:hypothetical protein
MLNVSTLKGWTYLSEDRRSGRVGIFEKIPFPKKQPDLLEIFYQLYKMPPLNFRSFFKMMELNPKPNDFQFLKLGI